LILHNAAVSGSCFLFHLNGFLLQETSLELVAVGDDGVLKSICEQDMFGIVKDIGVLQWHSRHIGLIPQVLYFLTDHNVWQCSLAHIPVYDWFQK
jgi:hypothetical protein